MISSRSVVTVTGSNPSIDGGSRVLGATSVTSAPSIVNAWMSLRATRLCLMSPTIAILQSVERMRSAERGADRVASSSACVGCACQPSPALTTLALRPLADLPGRSARLVPDDERVDPHRGDGLDRVAEALALVHARRRHGEVHRVGGEALGRGLERSGGCASSPRRTRCRRSCRATPAPWGWGDG